MPKQQAAHRTTNLGFLALEPWRFQGKQTWQTTADVFVLFCFCCLPVVPHKAVAEVSRIGNV